jgi:hypothetical protein
MFLLSIDIKLDNIELKDNIVLLVEETKLQKDYISVLKNKYQLQSQINLRLMNIICESDLIRIKKDSLYLNLIDSIN